jgi:hypothetical protein
MKRHAFVFASLALLLSSPLSGQGESATAPRGNTVTVVTITGTVNPTPYGVPPLPFAILQRLELDPFLRQMETEPRVQAGPSLLVTFVFPSVEAYRTWSETAATRQMLDDLQERVSRLSLTVSLRRDVRTFDTGDGG